jgi:hypothetical protein
VLVGVSVSVMVRVSGRVGVRVVRLLLGRYVHPFPFSSCKFAGAALQARSVLMEQSVIVWPPSAVHFMSLHIRPRLKPFSAVATVFMNRQAEGRDLRATTVQTR